MERLATGAVGTVHQTAVGAKLPRRNETLYRVARSQQAGINRGVNLVGL